MAAELQSSFEPLLPPVGHPVLEDRAFELIRLSSSLGGRLPPAVQQGIGDLVRSMNCYYSNLIEGHHTHPRDIDRALRADYSAEPELRDLQREAVAHIHVQQLVDSRQDSTTDVASIDYLRWLHREFCSHLPAGMLVVVNPDTGERAAVEPGQLRTRDVAVGRHVPPAASDLPRFLDRFSEAYAATALSRVQQVIATAAAHHRLLWIHPFLDGNGRVARLAAHAWLGRLGIGGSMWSVSRGLGRNADTYKQLLMAADAPRRSDTDGRGSLSLEALIDFCAFFLDVCIDQVRFMDSLLEPATLAARIDDFVARATAKGELPARAAPLLREALVLGDVPRSRAAHLMGITDRHARNLLPLLIDKGLLMADVPGILRLGFPIAAIDQWFPRLYPEATR